MKKLVTYFSQTGNTKKVAEAIYSAIGNEKEIREMAEVQNLDDYDLVFIGMPVHAFGPAQAGKDFLTKYSVGKKIALFITHAAPEDEPQVDEWVQKAHDSAPDAEILGTFHCQGELSEAIADFLMKSDDSKLQFFGQQREQTIGQPDELRLKKAESFAGEIMGIFKK